MAFINCTLIVQILNFFIAFFIIKYFFFKPVLAHINAEDSFQESLLNTVQMHKTIVAQKEQELVEQWNVGQKYFYQHSPVIRQEPFFASKPSIIKPEFDHHMIDSIAKQTAQQLIKKVDHVA
jgi:alpha-ketoglutarate-dependent taurine dioxygenase